MRDLIGLQAPLLLKRSQSLEPEQERTLGHFCHDRFLPRVTIVTKMRALPATAHSVNSRVPAWDSSHALSKLCTLACSRGLTAPSDSQYFTHLM